MKDSLHEWLSLPLAIVLAIGCSKHASDNDPIITVDGNDSEMNAAIKSARQTLPQFWQALERPEHGERDFALKVRITDGNSNEHFWLIDLDRNGDRIVGTVNNDPKTVSNVKLGDRRDIPVADISDWMYTRDGKIYGNYTIRPLFKSMAPADVGRIRQMLVDPEN